MGIKWCWGGMADVDVDVDVDVDSVGWVCGGGWTRREGIRSSCVLAGVHPGACGVAPGPRRERWRRGRGLERPDWVTSRIKWR